MLKKMMLLATAAAAVLAFAIPAAASAHEFRHEGAPIASGGETEVFTGNAQFVIAANGAGFNCKEVDADILLTPGRPATAHVQNFTATNPLTQCDPIGPAKALGCQLKEVNASATPANPWDIEVNAATELVITGVSIENVFQGAACIENLGPGITIFGTETLFPTGALTSPEAIEEVTLGGKLNSAAGEVNVSGTLVPEVPGTYGIIE